MKQALPRLRVYCVHVRTRQILAWLEAVTMNRGLLAFTYLNLLISPESEMYIEVLIEYY